VFVISVIGLKLDIEEISKSTQPEIDDDLFVYSESVPVITHPNVLITSVFDVLMS
jgi:hypothetical protein